MELNCLCSDCHHYTYIIEGGCAWCGSDRWTISPFGSVLTPSFVTTRTKSSLEHDVFTQINYGVTFRLAKGFAMLRASGDYA